MRSKISHHWSLVGSRLPLESRSLVLGRDLQRPDEVSRFGDSLKRPQAFTRVRIAIAPAIGARAWSGGPVSLHYIGVVSGRSMTGHCSKGSSFAIPS